MGLTKRLSTILKAKASKALDKAEDPRETLDYSYQRMLEQLTQVRRGVADVATSRKRLELQASQLTQAGAKLEEQARQAIAQNREDLAREALSRRASIVQQLQDLKTQHDQLDAQESQLTQASQRLQTKVESFRTRKETIKATYTAAQATTKVNEAVSGISEEMGDVGMAIQRAEDKTAQMQARAGALDELMASGALDDLSAPGDHIQAELDRGLLTVGVDAELERMKAELGQGSAPKTISAPQDTKSLGAAPSGSPSRARTRTVLRASMTMTLLWPITSNDRPLTTTAVHSSMPMPTLSGWLRTAGIDRSAEEPGRPDRVDALAGEGGRRAAGIHNRCPAWSGVGGVRSSEEAR